MFGRIVVSVVLVAAVAGSAVYFASTAASERQADKEQTPVAFDLPDQKEMGPTIDAAGIEKLIADTPDVIATVDGAPVSAAEYRRALKGLAANVAQQGSGVPEQAFENIRKNIADTMVTNVLLLGEAKAAGLAADPAEVESHLAQMKGQFPDEAAFTAALAEQGLTEADFRADMLDKMTVRKLIDKEILGKIVVDDAKAKEFYDANKAQFARGESVKASHILIRPTAEGDEKADADAKARAEAVVAELAGGADFAAVAKAKSEDPGSAATGGELGVFPRGRMVKEFDEATFAAEPGKVVGPVKTQFGYHIIKVAEKIPAGEVPFEEAKGQIAKKLQMEEAQKAFTTYLDSLKSRHDIQMKI
ncbi:MAG: peptidylprolyl isomerase [Nitrospinae bacterium]|nr:peptidylprolyl isomerase [Nitrospinota bacterium]